jgi:hypothetical protein
VSGQISGSGLSGAGTGAIQGRTVTGASDAPNAVSATIPSSHGMPGVAVSLVREGGDWKINVPDTLTPQRLVENLARQLSMANQRREQWPEDAKQAQQAIAHHVMMAITDTDAAAGGRGAGGADAGRDRSAGSATDEGGVGRSAGGGRNATGGDASGDTPGTRGRRERR